MSALITPTRPTVYVCASQAAAAKLAELDPTRETLCIATDTDTLAYLSTRTPCFIPDNTSDSRKSMADAASTLVNLGTDVFVHELNGAAPDWSLEDALAGGMTVAEFDALSFKRVTNNVVDIAKAKKVRQPRPSSSSDTAREKWRSLGLEFAHNGQPYENIDNALRAMTASGLPIWYDEFLQRPMTEWNCDKREFRDADYVDLTVWMQRDLELRKMSLRTVTAAADAYIRQNVRNCAQEWVNGLAWDQQPRLDSLAVDGFGTRDDPYHRAVLRCFLMSMVKRILEPGCQVDSMPVFEGPEGIRKSTALRILGGNWFAECHEEITGKDFLQIMPGKALLEISELYSFRRAEIERIKGIITNRVDRYRASYGRMAGDHPRMCVFAGTTNRDDWNASDTGARRFWPVECGIIDLDWLLANREQLFAEAAARVKAGEAHWDVPTDDARDMVDNRRAADPWENAIRRFCASRTEVDPEIILRDCLEFDLNKVDQGAAGRVRSCLRLIGWKSKSTTRGGIKLRVWVKGEYVAERLAEIKAEQAPPPKPMQAPIPYIPEPEFDSSCPF